jgi:hypothetical protein
VNDSYRKLEATRPVERVLLLSHCMRPSQTCPGKLSRGGLVCPEDCQEPCVAGRLRRQALGLGYKGVCIASGGAMAMRYVKENSPHAIVAVACHKELAEGVEAVAEWAGNGNAPAVVTVPLLTDGCIDTTVDEGLAVEVIGLGCRRNGEERAAGE